MIQTIASKRIDLPDGNYMGQHVTQPLRVQEVQVLECWVFIVQHHSYRKYFPDQRHWEKYKNSLYSLSYISSTGKILHKNSSVHTILMQERCSLIELCSVPERPVTSSGHLLGDKGMVAVCWQNRVTALHPAFQGQYAHHILQCQVGGRYALFQQSLLTPW